MNEDGERLRRRLYRPGAADADLEAYLAVAEPEPEPEEGPPPPPPRWRPTRPAVAAAVVLVHVVAGSALALQARQALHAPPPVAAPAPLPTHFVDPATAAAFESALDRGDDAGLGSWWDSTSPFVEQHGTGDGTVLLPVAASGGGRLTVLLVLADDGTAGWTASRLVIHDDRTIHLQAEASDYGSLRAGVPAIGRLDYTAMHQPLRLFVQAPTGTRWGVAAVISG